MFTLQRNPGARIALVNQHHGDQIDLDMTALDYLAAQYKKQHAECSREVVEQMRGHLTSCGKTSVALRSSNLRTVFLESMNQMTGIHHTFWNHL